MPASISIEEIDQQVAQGRNVPTCLIGYETPEKRPERDIAYATYVEAYNRLAAAADGPIRVSEMIAYHDRFDLPYSLDVFIDTVQALEGDAREKAAKAAAKQHKAGPVAGGLTARPAPAAPVNLPATNADSGHPAPDAIVSAALGA